MLDIKRKFVRIETMITYTLHAKQQMELRSISEKQVEVTIRSPDYTESSRENKEIYYKDFKKNYLKVVLVEEDYSFTVITTYWIKPTKIKFKKGK